MVRIESLEVDDHILEKIESKHGISFSQVEEASLSDNRHITEGCIELTGPRLKPWAETTKPTEGAGASLFSRLRLISPTALATGAVVNLGGGWEAAMGGSLPPGE